MSKVININELHVAIILHCSRNRIDLPECILDDIVQKHESIQKELTEGFYTFKQAYHEYTLEMKIFKSAAKTELHVRRVRDNETVFTHFVAHQFIEKENPTFVPEPCEKETITDHIKNTYQNIRLNTLLNKLKTTTTPTEAFQLLCEYLEEDTEISGTIMRKETTVEYSLRYVKEKQDVLVKLIVCNKDNRVFPIISLSLSLDNKSIETAYHSILSLVELAK